MNKRSNNPVEDIWVNPEDDAWEKLEDINLGMTWVNDGWVPVIVKGEKKSIPIPPLPEIDI